MAKTAAQRQTDYRARRINSGPSADDDRRLNTWISTSASLSLIRLAANEGVSKRVIIERLVQLAYQKLIDSLELDTKEWNDYFLAQNVTQ